MQHPNAHTPHQSCYCVLHSQCTFISAMKLEHRFKLKSLSYKCRKSHHWDRMVVRPSFFHNRNSYTGNIFILNWTTHTCMWSGSRYFDIWFGYLCNGVFIVGGWGMTHGPHGTVFSYSVCQPQCNCTFASHLSWSGTCRIVFLWHTI